MRASITLRVGLLTALLAFAANLAVIAFIYGRTHGDDGEALRRQVSEEAAALGDVYASGGRPALQRAIAESLDSGDPQLLAGLVDGQGKGAVGNVESIAKAPSAGYRSGLVRTRGADVEAGIALRPLPGGLWLVSGRTIGERLALQRTLERSLLVASVFSILLGLVCGLVIARYVGRRVDAVASVADRITGGDLTQRVAITGSGDAFDTLARQVNRMLDRIGALMDELRMLTDCLAHDLRSPVGRLRARVDAAMAAGERERDSLLAGVLQEADSLMRILTTVLEIGRSEAMTSRNQFAWLDPAELAGELAEMYEPIAEEKGMKLGLDIGPALLPLFGHRQLLAQALSNLVDNAFHYGGEGGEIRLFARRDDGHIRIGVEDRGRGIAEEDRAEARRRFGRLDASRANGGAGLGLALAAAVAHLHEGDLALEDNDPGLRASLCIPQANAD